MQIIEKRASADGAIKYLLAANDGARVEAVFLKLDDNDKDSLCISSQVGCALACRFCSTGRLGFARNLTAAEIVDQVQVVLSDLRFEVRRRFDLSYMGMGEPLQNLEAVIESKNALRELFPDFMFHLSTVGLVPKMRALGQRSPDFSMQLSLHAPTDELRGSILPINDTYSIADVLDAAEHYAECSGRAVVLNYCLIRDVNDSPELAHLLAERISGRPLRVQLVLFNPHDWLEFHPSTEERALSFLSVLQDHGIPSHYGRQLGRDVGAGCGQLDADYRRHQFGRLATLSATPPEARGR